MNHYDSLDGLVPLDLDPLEMFEYIRHIYLDAARDLTTMNNHSIDIENGILFCQVAEKMQEAIDLCYNII